MSQPFTLRVRLFAQAAQIAGSSVVAFELQSLVEESCQTTVEQIAERLSAEYPQMATLIHRSRWAVDNEFVTREHCVSSEQSVAMIPPVSGG